MLFAFALPSQAINNMTTMNITFGPASCAGDVTLKVTVPGGQTTSVANIASGDSGITKAYKVAVAFCNLCGATPADCALLSPTGGVHTFTCFKGSTTYTGTHIGGSLTFNNPLAAGGLNAVICKVNNACENESMTSSSPPNIAMLSIQRLTTPTPVEGNLVITVNEGPPVTSISVPTSGKSDLQIVNDAATALKALPLGINAYTATICNEVRPPTEVTSYGEELHSASKAALVMQGIAGNSQLTEFKYQVPGPGWAVTGEGAWEFAPSKTPTPALSTWGFTALVGLILLAGTWILRRGLLR